MFRFIELVITLLVILSMIRRVLKFFQSFTAGTQNRTPAQPQQPQQAAQSGSTMLQQDPVCGTYVSVETSLKRLQGGRVIHFCSPECRDRYAI